MKLEKAIELIQSDINDEDVDWNSPLGKAYKLSFEALKRMINQEKNACYYIGQPLPGETKD